MAERVAESAVEELVVDESAVGLEMRLFGPMEVRVCGNPLPRLRSRKGLWLLAILALRGGRDLERDWLAGTLWPDSKDADARRSLRQSLHDLRLALGPEAERLKSESPQTICLDLSGDAWLDITAFDAATSQTAGLARTGRQTSDLETAVGLYRGPLLEDCAEEWVLDERRHREQQYVQALDTLASTAKACREYGAAVSYLRRAVGVDPLREDLQRSLMESLAAEGSASAALQVFRQFRTRLWQEMATEPDAETTALYRRLSEEAREKAQSTAVSAPPSTTPTTDSSTTTALPQPRTALIGREDDTEQVIICLAHSRLVTLTGTGGIGKTSLALRVAEGQADEFESGARFVDLAPLADPSGVPEAVRKTLGMLSSPAALVEAIISHIQHSRLLLVLDNCEQVLDACAKLVDALLVACPGLRILATSRQALGLRGETVWRVPSLALPPPSTAEIDYREYAAPRLFVERARDADSSFQITPRNAPALLSICRQLDGIPLAIELAAARARVLTVEEIDARLSDQFRLLTGGDRAAMPRQQTLRGALDWSWDLLTDSERTLLSRLSVFAGGWTLEAAEKVCVGDDVDELDVLDLTTALIDKSLTQAEKREDGTMRYRLLEPIRQYAAHRLAERGTDIVGITRKRHQEYFAGLGELAVKGNTEKAAWLFRLDIEHDNLRAALDWKGYSPETRQEAAWNVLNLSANLEHFWLARGHGREGRERLRAALDFAEETCTDKDSEEYLKSQAHALRGLASQERDSGDYPAAQKVYEQTLELYRRLNDRSLIAAMLSESGLLFHFQSDFARAKSLLEEGLAIYRELGDRRCIALSVGALGVLAGDMGELDRARAFLEESLEIQRDLGEKRGVAVTLTNLGINAQYRGDYDSAKLLLLEALALHRSLGNQRSVAIALLSLGGVMGDLGDYVESLRLLEEALTLFRTSGNKKGIAATLTTLGITLAGQGDNERALTILQESICLHRELNDQQNIATNLHAVAAVCSSQGKTSHALRLWGAAEALREALGIPMRLGDRLEYEQMVAETRARLDSEAASAAWAEGRRMNTEIACNLALLP